MPDYSRKPWFAYFGGRVLAKSVPRLTQADARFLVDEFSSGSPQSKHCASMSLTATDAL